MVKKTMTAVIMAIGSTVALTAAEPRDSLPVKNLDEVTVTGNSARQRIENVRLGTERLELVHRGIPDPLRA